MPKVNEHLQKAMIAREVSAAVTEKHLERTGGPSWDWVIIALFYCALHLVEAAFDQLSRPDCENHRERDEAMRRDQDLRAAAHDYRMLFQLCHAARYSANESTPAETERAKTHYKKVASVVQAAGVRLEPT